MMLKRKNRRFSIMVAGYKGSGKSSFFNTLFNNEIVPMNAAENINLYMLNVDCEGVTQKISLIDTPGFGNELDDTQLHNSLIKFVEQQFDIFMEEECKIRRDPHFEDPRVHCLLYFIPSTGNGLKNNDIQFLKKIQTLVNIIPVLSKSDGITLEDRRILKSKIMHQLQENNITIFDFEHKDYYEKLDEGQSINEYLPFCLVSCNEKAVKSRERRFKWGAVEIDNAEHCDFAIFKEIILGTHLNILIDYTGSELYETYRANALERKMSAK